MNATTVFNALEATVDEASFLKFVDALLSERLRVDELPLVLEGFQGEWANNSVSGFLSAAKAWAEDSDFGARPGPKSPNPWRLFADFLYAGRGYE